MRSSMAWSSSLLTVSIGQISSRTNSAIQSSCCANSGSVEKSHAITSRRIADPSSAVVTRGGRARFQERLDAATRILCVKQRNGRVEQQGVGAGDAALQIPSRRLFDEADREGGAGGE